MQQAKVTMLPHEFSIVGVYFPPLLIAAILGVCAGLATGSVLNRYRLSRYFARPPLVMISLCTVFTSSTVLPG
jgi:hypothetical protein